MIEEEEATCCRRQKIPRSEESDDWGTSGAGRARGHARPVATERNEQP